MKVRTRMLAAAMVLSVWAACSDTSETPADGAVADGRVDGLGRKPAGEPCALATECQSAVCFEGTCAKACTKAADCAAAEECSSDDGKRLFCHAATYSKQIGSSCAVTATCPGASWRCVGGKEYGRAYCTAECTTDLDCPLEFRCREYSDKKSYCTRRDFCSPCLLDAQCGTGNKCVKQGTASFCSRPCTSGSTECPRYAECKDTGGGKFYCLHRAGTCAGTGKLCQPCVDEKSCAKGALCLFFSYTQELFCGQDCSSGSCPSKYTCSAITTSTGTSKQCVPQAPATSDLPSCVTIAATGEVGDKLQDFAMVGYIDTNYDNSLVGERLRIVKLSDFSAKSSLLLFNLSAGWCGPCQSETAQFAYLMKTYGPKGLMIFQSLFDGKQKGQKPTFTFLDEWVQVLKPLGAVGLDPGRESVVYNTSGTTPLNMLVDAKTFKVLEKFNGFSLSTVEAKIKQHLNL